jgi:hypothetical protein
MRLLFCLVMLTWMAVLPAQDAYFARLAGEVCSCMERFSVEPVDQQAINCMREVALANKETLRKRYSLNAAEATQRDFLADRLAGDLLRDCPLLGTLNYDKEEELRWSDGGQQEIFERLPFQSVKNPPADAAGGVTGEPPLEWMVEGTVQRLSGGRLQLLLATGKTMDLELPTGISRLRRMKAGDELKLSFRREWRKGARRIINVVVGLKE